MLIIYYVNMQANNSLLIREKGESQKGCYKKTKHIKRAYAYHGIRNVHFSENLVCFVFL